jgi:FemAB-related protein (PEP-CTERM system-associated)
VNAAGLRLVSTVPVSVRDDVPADVTDAYVESHRNGTSYHRQRWAQVIARAFKHDTKYLTAEAGGEIIGVLPLVFFRSRLFGRFTVSLPFLNYGGVLADGPEAARTLLARAIEETRHSGGTHLELRHDRQQFTTLAAKRHKVAMELPLEATVDAQWQAIDRKLRNQVRKAEKSGLVVSDGGSELLPQFYEVFARNMRDLGTPVYGAAFFREVRAVFPDHSRIVVVTLDGRPVAASVLHWYKQRVEVPWASSLREFNPLCANVLLYWHMLRFSIEREFHLFDFGRSTPGEGTFHFKKQWGAEARELVWEYWLADGQPLPEMNPRNPKFSMAIRAWQRLPVPLATVLGPRIVRNIP